MAKRKLTRGKAFQRCFRSAAKHAKRGHAAFDRALHACLTRLTKRKRRR